MGWSESTVSLHPGIQGRDTGVTLVKQSWRTWRTSSHPVPHPTSSVSIQRNEKAPGSGLSLGTEARVDPSRHLGPHWTEDPPRSR